jgi:hypothetical protein
MVIDQAMRTGISFTSHKIRRLSPARRPSQGRALMEMMRDIGCMVAMVVSSFDFPLHVSSQSHADLSLSIRMKPNTSLQQRLEAGAQRTL